MVENLIAAKSSHIPMIIFGSGVPYNRQRELLKVLVPMANLKIVIDYQRMLFHLLW